MKTSQISTRCCVALCFKQADCLNFLLEVGFKMTLASYPKVLCKKTATLKSPNKDHTQGLPGSIRFQVTET